MVSQQVAAYSERRAVCCCTLTRLHRRLLCGLLLPPIPQPHLRTYCRHGSTAAEDSKSFRRSTSQSPPRRGAASHNNSANHDRHHELHPLSHSSRNPQPNQTDPQTHPRVFVSTFDLTAGVAATSAPMGFDHASGGGGVSADQLGPAAGTRAAQPVGLTASGRETQSQKAALRALHRRREQQQYQTAAAVAAAAELRHRVRSYSVIRDESAPMEESRREPEAIVSIRGPA